MTPPVIVWRGDHMLPDHQQGIVVLGTPLGHEEFVKQLRCKLQEHSLLLQRIEAVTDLQCASLILMFCAAARANYFPLSGSPWVVGGIREAARRGHLAKCFCNY